MPADAHAGHGVPDLERALCRLLRGAPGAAADAAAAALTERHLVERVSAAEARDAEEWAALAAEGERVRTTLQAMRPPGGVAAWVPGAGRRYQERRDALQAGLDACNAQRREIEERYTGAQRARWPLLPFAAPETDGARLLLTPEGRRKASAFWSSPGAMPSADQLAPALAGAAGRTAAFARALAGWRPLPPDAAWLYAALLGPRRPGQQPGAMLDVLRTLHQWLERQEFWGDDPLPVAAILAMAPAPGEAARAAAATYEALRPRFGTGPETFATASRLEARAGWVSSSLRLQSLEVLLRRVDDVGLTSVHRALPLVAPLCALPQPGSETGAALCALREALYRRHPGAPGTLAVAAVVLAGTGLYHAPRREEQAALRRSDPVADAFAARYDTLHAALAGFDGPTAPPGRLDIVAAAAATLPGTTERIMAALGIARQLLADAGGPVEAGWLSPGLVLVGACCGPQVGLDPCDFAWELICADAIAQAAWRPLPSAGAEAVPSFKVNL